MSRGLSLLGAGVALVLLIWSIVWALAYQRFEETRHHIEGLEQTGWIDSGKQLHKYIERAQHGLVWNPHQADQYLRLARLYQWRAYEQRLWSDLARNSQTRAVALIAEACRRRPTWGLAWALLASAELEIGRDDAKVEHALNRAIVLAPWGRQVLHQVVVVGMKGWRRFSGQTQDAIVASIRRALSDRVLIRHVMDMAIRNGWEEHLRPLVADNAELDTLFRHLLARRRV